jgi:hypothetical protein
MTSHNNKQMIIVDESISSMQFEKVLDYLKLNNSKLTKILHVKETYPGIPDEEILNHLIKINSIFITADRVIHNKILLQHKRSIYINKNWCISEKLIKGITISAKDKNNKSSELLVSCQL